MVGLWHLAEPLTARLGNCLVHTFSLKQSPLPPTATSRPVTSPPPPSGLQPGGGPYITSPALWSNNVGLTVLENGGDSGIVRHMSTDGVFLIGGTTFFDINIMDTVHQVALWIDSDRSVPSTADQVASDYELVVLSLPGNGVFEADGLSVETVTLNGESKWLAAGGTAYFGITRVGPWLWFEDWTEPKLLADILQAEGIELPTMLESIAKARVDPATGTVHMVVKDYDPDSGYYVAITGMFPPVIVEGPEWQNPVNRWDVDGDGNVAPLDVLTLINDINTHGSRSLPTRPSGPVPPFFDVDGDGSLTPSDVLTVINYINSRVAGSAGEGESRNFSSVSTSPFDGAAALPLVFSDAVRSANSSSSAVGPDWPFPPERWLPRLPFDLHSSTRVRLPAAVDADFWDALFPFDSELLADVAGRLPV